MSGLVTAGALLCGVHIANAQTNIDTGYTITISSGVGIDKDSGKASFPVTGKVKAQSTIDVAIQSKNGYKLKNKSKELSYSIDKKSFSFDNSKSASDLNINEVFNITSETNTNFSGNYEDNLTFDITSETYKYRLDVNGNLDNNGIGNGRLDDFGRFDVYLNGQLVKENVEDFCEVVPYGTTWEIKNIRSLDGYHYKEDSSIKTKGIIGKSFEYEGHLDGVGDNSSIYRISYVNLQYYTNKLTINYHADGAQIWKTAYTDNASEIDVSGKDIMETEYLKYNELYDEDAGKRHFCSIARIKRDGYTAKANTWKVGQKGSLEVLDYKTLQKAQDVAEYCGVLNQFKKNDTVIDLYPIWIPNTYTLTYILDGGSFNASTTQLFKYGSGDAISSEIPVKTGYSFTGWKWGDVIMQPGDTISKGWGNFTLTAQWKKAYSAGTVLNIDDSDYIVMSQTDDGNYLVISGASIGNIQYQPNKDSNGNYVTEEYETPNEKRSDGQNSNTYEDSYIDNYLENTWYEQLSDNLKNAIQEITITQTAWENIGSDSKWKYLTKNSSPPSPDGTYGWFFNEGTESYPRWVHIDYANTPNNASGAHPFSKWEKRSIGYENQKYNAILRHVFLPSVEELNEIIDLENANKTYSFLRGTNNSVSHIWTRDSSFLDSYHALNLSYRYKSISYDTPVSHIRIGVRPAFVIDLSKIDYTVTGTVNYK